MKATHFSEQLEAALERLAMLEQQVQATGDETGIQQETLVELSIVLEELGVAEEELYQQNDELLTTRHRLELERQRYQDLFHFAPDGYLVTDTLGVIKEANHAATTLLKVRQDFLVGKPLLIFVAKQDHQTLRMGLIGFRAGNQTQAAWEVRLQPRKSAAFPVALTVAAAHNPAGELIGLRWLLRDITQRKQAEESLKKYQDQLEMLVAERTAKLSQANQRLQREIIERRRAEQSLRESHRRLEEMLIELRAIQQQALQQERLAAVGQLAAGIAHDFNNILTGIMGFAELLRLRPDMPGEAQEDLERILKQSERAAHLVRQILDFSRKSIRWPELLDLAAFLTTAVKFLQRTIPENIHIGLTIEPVEHWVSADPTQLHQALTNLAINARDAMPDGGELGIRLGLFILKPGEPPPCPDMPPGKWLACTVFDTGSGIPATALPHIFEPFFTTKEPGHGTGLGLAQVHGIIKQHEGYINVVSQVGRGTTFIIYLPALAVGEGKEETSHTDAPVEIPHGRGQTVLLVEDEPAVLQVSKTVLETLGYQVLTATNGQEALAVYAEHKEKVALVLADIVMPEMNGLALLRVLQAQSPDIKVIFMSGYPLAEVDQQFLAEWMIEWIPKPLTFSLLAQILSRALYNHDHPDSDYEKAKEEA